MLQAAKIIGIGLATTGLIGAGVGIGVVFGALIIVYQKNSSLWAQIFSLNYYNHKNNNYLCTFLAQICG